MILEIVPDSGTEIRVDGATSFQALQTEALTDDSLFKSMGIKIVVGRLLNKNKTRWRKTLSEKSKRKFYGLKEIRALLLIRIWLW